MIAETAQAAVEVAKAGTINIAIPTALISSVATILGREAIAAYFSRRKGRNGHGNGGPKPGFSEECLKHRDRLTELETKQENDGKILDEVRLDVKKILAKVGAA